MNQNRESLSTAQAAERIGITTPTLHRWRKVGHILAVELPNGHFRIPVSEVERITGAKVKTKIPKHERRFTVAIPVKDERE